ncbi:segregation and condensation protein A [Desulfofalx alkaliphila]|uniref:segregation and condensation protein A n=1 Tax=Desulfofalx alkaliphila TaxID=105483 RepID=UPI00068EF1E8|nr:segregation/condensation protein A [Desulfofalx alkaliphila]
MAYTVRLDAFEGPLDLLLHLIEKDQLDIQDIPIASITAQYFEYLETMKQMDLEVTSEFLVMASTLLAIKTHTLLPKPELISENAEEEPDPRQQLVQRLLEYKQYKEAAMCLKERQQVQGRVFTRPNSLEMYQHLIRPPEPLAGIDFNELLKALQAVLERAVKVIPPKVRAEEIKIQDKIGHILRRLVLYPKGMPFRAAFSKNASRAEIIVTFLALLELLRMGQVELEQKDRNAEIMILPAKGEFTEYDGVIS